jgi:hypothetical protein
MCDPPGEVGKIFERPLRRSVHDPQRSAQLAGRIPAHAHDLPVGVDRPRLAGVSSQRAQVERPLRAAPPVHLPRRAPLTIALSSSLDLSTGLTLIGPETERVVLRAPAGIRIGGVPAQSGSAPRVTIRNLTITGATGTGAADAALRLDQSAGRMAWLTLDGVTVSGNAGNLRRCRAGAGADPGQSTISGERSATLWNSPAATATKPPPVGCC